jgi:hypothetical protein
MAENAVAGFLPSKSGFKFVNSFPSEPTVTLEVPGIGKLGIGNASNGLCGGMAFAVRDLFESRLPPPPDTTPPAAGSPLFEYLVKRLLDSFNLPQGLMRYYAWMCMPDEDTGAGPLLRHGIAWHTLTEEWPKVQTTIDAGSLAALGLIAVASSDPRKLGHNHQVLAYGYEVDGNATLTLRLYDPNTDAGAADGVNLAVSLCAPTQRVSITHNVAIDSPIRGFFVTPYTFSDPTPAAR